MHMNIWGYGEKVKIVHLTDMCHQRGIRVEGSKGQVRSEMPATVEPRVFLIWCVWRHLIGSHAHKTLAIWI